MQIQVRHNLSGKQQLIEFYETALHFPYRSCNWDGLSDSLNDLSWLEDNELEIFHVELPNLNSEDLPMYLIILYECEQTWRLNGGIHFKVNFAPQILDVAKSIIDNCIRNTLKRSSLCKDKMYYIGYDSSGLIKSYYLLFGSFCFVLDADNPNKIDYYVLTVFQESDIKHGVFTLLLNTDETIVKIENITPDAMKNCQIFKTANNEN